jgi:hypothetical protein
MALLLRPLYLFVCLLVLTGCAITTDRDVRDSDETNETSYESRTGSITEDGAYLQYQKLEGNETLYRLAANHSYTIDVQQRTDEGELGVVLIDAFDRVHVLRERNVIECVHGDYVIKVIGKGGSGTVSISLETRDLAIANG